MHLIQVIGFRKKNKKNFFFHLDSAKNYSNLDDMFLEAENFKYDVYFNQKLVENLLSNSQTPRLSFIAYKTQKLFKSQNVSKLNELNNCINQNFLTINVLSASIFQNITPTNDLINILFGEQEVSCYLFLNTV